MGKNKNGRKSTMLIIPSRSHVPRGNAYRAALRQVTATIIREMVTGLLNT